MAKLIEKVIKMESKADIIKYQLLNYCFLNRIKLSECDMDCLVLLGLAGEQELVKFCSHEAISDELIKHERWYKEEFSSKGKKRGLFKSSQSVRNFINRQTKKGLIVKQGKSKKKIKLNPDLGIYTGGSVLLNYKIAYLES